MLKTNPAIFVVGNQYHIMAPVNVQCVMWVKIADKNYYDEKNGVMCSAKKIHRVIVPREALDNAKEYTVCVQEIKERLAYYTEGEKVTEYKYFFRPVRENARAYIVSDAHTIVEEVISAAKAYGKIDFLVLCGDNHDDSETVERFFIDYEIASELAEGEIPIVFARGNHDLRSDFAEDFTTYMPNESGNTYYTFRIGDIWGIVLDCGEDKPDWAIEYGPTVSCHDFRLRQTEFIKQVIARKETEFEAEGVKHKIVVSHNPFTRQYCEPFNIEEDVYKEWASLIGDYIKPELMICGHTHTLEINKVRSEKDYLGQPCTVLVSGKPGFENGKSFAGAGIYFAENGIEATFTDNTGAVLRKEIVS